MESIKLENVEKANPKFVRFGGKLSDVIEDYNKGLNNGYNLISEQVKDSAIKSSQLFELLKDFKEAAHLLEKNQKQLVCDVLRIKWYMREKEIVELYHIFVIELATSNPVHLVLVLNSLVTTFNNCMSKTEETCLPQEEIFHSIHKTLQDIFTLIPVSTTMICPLLAANFPFIKREAKILEWYMKNLLYITTYQPSLRSQVLELVINNGLKIDTMLTRENIEEAVQSDDDLFEMEMEKKDCFVDKLEITMETLLQYVCDVCYRDDRLIHEADFLMRELVEIFNKVILPVHECSHIQFLLFYMCSLKQSFYEYFLDNLWQKVQDPNVPVILRQTAMSYIASLLARARFIPLKTVTSLLKSIVGWTHQYIKERQEEGSNNFTRGAARHGTFYAICQAACYIIIFQHKNILDCDNGHQFFLNLNLSHIVLNGLNPLKFCINTVVDLFSSIMRINQIVYCDTIIEKNNRQRIPISGKSESNPCNPLDSFFPFDPYLLRNSKPFIEPLYQEWEGRVPKRANEHLLEDENEILNEEDAPNAISILDPDSNNNDHMKVLSGSTSMSPGFSLINSLAF